MEVSINSLEESDKQVLDLATEILYSQQVEMVLYYQLPVFCFGGTSLLDYYINCEQSGNKSNTNLNGFFIGFNIK